MNLEKKYGTVSGFKQYAYGKLGGEDNQNREPAGAPDGKGGQFAKKDGGGNVESKINDFKNELRDKVKPNKKLRSLQEEVDIEITDNIWEAVEDMGIKDKIKDVQMQGSYAKGTDLPDSGSDLDLFVVFNTDVPADEREKLGVEIGKRALKGKNSYTQTATTKYEEAFFDHKGETMEVQIVPIRHLTLDQIQNKQLDGEEISIGMERTPHQTAFMKQALKGKEADVRMLKKFMKETQLYDSSMKSQGFSGYSAEVLIHNKDTFGKVLETFANLKKGDTIGSDNGKKYEKMNNNNFHLIDPIDPNRDLISAFSPLKIGRTIKTAQYFLEHGEAPPKPSKKEMKSVSVSFDTSQFNEDQLVGQSRKSQNALIDQLKILGFNVDVKSEKVNGMDIPIPRAKMNKEEGETKTTLTFGIDDYDIPPTYEDKGVPLEMDKAVDAYRKSNPNAKFVEKDGRLKAIKKRPFTNIASALQSLTTNRLEETGMSKGTIKDMKNGVRISTKDSDEFENIL